MVASVLHEPQLPSYSNPPVIEVASSVAFQPLAGFTAAHAGDFWQSYLRSTFGSVEERPPYIPQVERFGAGVQMPPFPFQFTATLPPPRLWFVTSDGTELVQVQRDWFACNWRKVQPKTKYERWQNRRASFQHWYETFLRYLNDQGLGPPTPFQFEVTYVNHLLPDAGIGSTFSELSQAIPLFGSSLGRFLSVPEHGRIDFQYLIPSGTTDLPLGRLHIEAQPALRAEDRKPMIVLTLTARGGMSGPAISDIVTRLDLGRAWIVQAFADVTSDRAQEVWGREQ